MQPAESIPVLTWGVISAGAGEKHRTLTLPTPPLPRVLDYQRTFGQFAQNDVMQ
jgi:hypothetical protein